MSEHYDNLIIDGNNFLFRAFFNKLSKTCAENPDNGEINHVALFVFLEMLKSHVIRHTPSTVYITWDTRIGPTEKNYRHDLLPYKEQRMKTELIDKMFLHLPIINEFMSALGVKTVYPYTMEADDVVYYLSKTCEGRNMVVSSDDDLMQAVSEKTDMFKPCKNTIINLDNFETYARVPQYLFVLYKSIMGDKSDNISGLYKHGPVRAKALAEMLYDPNRGIDDTYIYNILPKDQADVVIRNMKVIDLSIVDKLNPSEYSSYNNQLLSQTHEFDADKLINLFTKYKMTKFIRTFGNWNALFNHNFDESDLLFRITM